jgi:serine/threonine protein kinase
MEDLPTEPAAPETAASSELGPGARIGRYLVRELLGRGGMGAVYAAHDPELDRAVAIKVIAAEAKGTASTRTHARARLLREAQAMAKLAHPNVITVHDVGTFGEQVFVAMELVEGVTLRQWLKEASRSIDAIVETFRSAGEGLVAAHAAGIVHRDFKPDNVLVGLDGRVRVLDFGLARASDGGPRAEASPTSLPLPRVSAAFAQETTLEAPPSGAGGPASDALAATVEASPNPSTPAVFSASLTQTGTFLGTPLYMAPELYLGGSADARSDQYAFCVALHEALYGEPPFGAKTMKELFERATEGKIVDPPQDPRVATHLRGVVVRGLSPRPEDRFPSVRALLDELVRPAEAPRRLWPIAAMALAGAALLGTLFFLHRAMKGPPDVAPAGFPSAAAPGPPSTIRQERVTFGGDVWSTALSPDGQKLAYVSGRKLMLRDLASGEERKLADAGPHAVAWSPDGLSIAYGGVVGGRPKRVSIADGSISDGKGGALDCAPDGTCTEWNPGSPSIRIDWKDGTSSNVAIVAPHQWVRGVSVSPDSRRLAVIQEP